MARRNVDLVIRNGTIVSGGGRFQADIAVADGQIIGIGRAAELALQPAEAFDATGCYVLPGVIDGHVHFREPGLEYKEDFESGSRAAVMGGVTTVIDMPNTRPPTASGVLVAEKRRLAQAKAYCDVALFGLLGADNLDELEPMAEAGVVGFKCFLGETVGNLPPPDDGALLDALQLSRGLGLRVGFHAENNAILQHATAALRASGRTDVWQAVSGFAGVETSVPLFLTYAVAQGRLSLERYVRRNAGARMGTLPTQGRHPGRRRCGLHGRATRRQRDDPCI